MCRQLPRKLCTFYPVSRFWFNLYILQKKKSTNFEKSFICYLFCVILLPYNLNCGNNILRFFPMGNVPCLTVISVTSLSASQRPFYFLMALMGMIAWQLSSEEMLCYYVFILYPLSFLLFPPPSLSPPSSSLPLPLLLPPSLLSVNVMLERSGKSLINIKSK